MDRAPGEPSAYTIQFPEYFDSYAGEIEAKGVFTDVKIVVGDKTHEPVFYDLARLAQDIAADLERDGLFSVGAIVVVPRVTREEIEAAVATLSEGGFSRLKRW